MSLNSSRNNLFWSAIIAAGVTTTGALLYLLLRPKKLSPIVTKPSTDITTKETTQVTSKNAAIVEEIDEDEEDEDDDNEDETKAAYESANSMAKKLLAGNKYQKAAEKYSEAIDLLSKHSFLGSSKDMLALYNNRSAMYEKQEAYQAAIEDILIVLTLDPLHVKARIRRSRIYEAQGKLPESIGDYTIAIFIEQTKGERSPATTLEKFEALCGIQAKQEMPLYLEQFKAAAAASTRDLPCAGYIRPYFESFPVHYIRAELGEYFAHPAYSSVLTSLQAHSYVNAQTALLPLLSEDAASIDALLLADTKLLQGTLAHLQYHLSLSRACYEEAIALTQGSLATGGPGVFYALLIQIETKMKLAQLFCETEDLSKMHMQLLSVLVDLEELQKTHPDHAVLLSTLTAWTNVHKASYWLAAADQQGSSADPASCVSKALESVEAAESLLTAVTASDRAWSIAQACSSLVWLKYAHIKIQSAAVANAPLAEEDTTVILARLAQVTSTEQAEMMRAEMFICAQQFEAAVETCERAMQSQRHPDASPLVVMTSAQLRIAMTKMQEAQYAGDQTAVMQAQASLGDIVQVFERALQLEPNSVEALFRFAQFKSMMGDFGGALDLATQAIGFARGKEEMEELKKLILMYSAQADAVTFLQKTMRY